MLCQRHLHPGFHRPEHGVDRDGGGEHRVLKRIGKIGYPQNAVVGQKSVGQPALELGGRKARFAAYEAVQLNAEVGGNKSASGTAPR